MHRLWIKVTIESASGAGVASCFLMCPLWFSSAHGSFSLYFFTVKFFPPSAKMALSQYRPYTWEGKSTPVTFSGHRCPPCQGFWLPSPQRVPSPCSGRVPAAEGYK